MYSCAQKPTRKAEVMHTTKEHEGRSHIPPNGSIDTVATMISRILSRMFRNTCTARSVAGMTTRSLDELASGCTACAALKRASSISTSGLGVIP